MWIINKLLLGSTCYVRSLVEAVSYTIEMESYLQRPAKLAPVTTEEPPLVNIIETSKE